MFQLNSDHPNWDKVSGQSGRISEPLQLVPGFGMASEDGMVKLRGTRAAVTPFSLAAALSALGIVAVLSAGYYRFGSLAVAARYVAGERLLVDQPTKSFGLQKRGSPCTVFFRLMNATVASVRILAQGLLADA